MKNQQNMNKKEKAQAKLARDIENLEKRKKELEEKKKNLDILVDVNDVKDDYEERLDAYKRMREKFGDKWEIFIKTLAEETAALQQTSPSESLNHATVKKESTKKKSV